MTSTAQICNACGVSAPVGVVYKRCTGCSIVRYCGRTCQKAHWTVHKPICKFVRLEVASSTLDTTASLSTPSTSNVVSSSTSTVARIVPATRACVPPDWKSSDGSRPLMSFPTLGVDLRITNTKENVTIGTSRKVGKFGLALYTTRDHKAGDLVFREGTDLVNTYEELVPRVFARPWVGIMFPRFETKVTFNESYTAVVDHISKKHPHLDSKQIFRLISKVQFNMFSLGVPPISPSLSSTALSAEPTALLAEPEQKLQAIFPLAQFANHACQPNVLVILLHNSRCAFLRMYALRDIRAGEQLLHSYIDNIAGEKPEFVCGCVTCRESGVERKSLADIAHELPPGVIDAILAAGEIKFKLDAHIDAAHLTNTMTRANADKDAAKIYDASAFFEATCHQLPAPLRALS